jgi:hypothetical protein
MPSRSVTANATGQLSASRTFHGAARRIGDPRPNRLPSVSQRTPITEQRCPTRRRPGGGVQVDRDVVDVDVLDAELRRERPRDVLREEPAVLDEDPAEPAAGPGLLRERLVEQFSGGAPCSSAGARPGAGERRRLTGSE